jgi:hypothetical protein
MTRKIQLQKEKNTELKVVDVRYYKTRRGVGYQCRTNIQGVEICNDGNGGPTFVDGYKLATSAGVRRERLDDEWHLESLIDEYEQEKELKERLK